MTVSENPARIAGLHHVGQIAVGRRADFAMLSAKLELRATIVAGVIRFAAE